MSEPGALGIAVAFAAGLLSFLSPCVLPLVPSYVGFLTGMTLPEMSGRRRIALLHALCFVAGFSLVFILLGASATALGRALLALGDPASTEEAGRRFLAASEASPKSVGTRMCLMFMLLPSTASTAGDVPRAGALHPATFGAAPRASRARAARAGTSCA